MSFLAVRDAGGDPPLGNSSRFAKPTPFAAHGSNGVVIGAN